MLGMIYPSWIKGTVDDTYSYTGATYTALLLAQTYTFSTAHTVIADLNPAGNEIDSAGATGYSRASVTGLSTSLAGSTVSVTFDQIVFSTVTAAGAAAPRYMALAQVGVDDSSSPLVLLQDFESVLELADEDLAITPSAAGFIRYVVS